MSAAENYQQISWGDQLRRKIKLKLSLLQTPLYFIKIYTLPALLNNEVNKHIDLLNVSIRNSM